MNSNQKGNIGEAKVIAYFLSEGYDIFIPFGTATTFDLIVHKNDILHRVSIKTTTATGRSKSYVVSLRQITRKGAMPFNNTSCDILAVYILPEDRVVLYNAADITSIRSLSIKPMAP